MASEKITAIVESVKTMTVLELKELVDTICEEFGVSAVAAAAPAAAGAAAPRKKWIYLEHFQNHTVKFSFLYKNKTVICVFRAKRIRVADIQKPPRGLHHGAVWKRFK